MIVPDNIAIVHEWFVSMRGGEKCVEAMCELFPAAHLYAIVHKKGSVSPTIENMPVRTSLLQRLPFGVSHYQWYLPVLPKFAEGLDLRDYDLVISSSHAVAKGVRVRDDALHVCYCHTPMRYIWDQYEQYFGEDRAGFVTRTVMKMFVSSLRRWDVETSNRVNHFIANSNNVRERILRIYNRHAEVIHPPVDIHRFSVSPKDDGYYLIVSALVPYKRIDVAIEAFNKSKERLVIVGSGLEEQRLKRRAGSNIEFVGWASDDELVRYYEGCRALIFPGEEDFGIAPLEAMACGKPVVAYAKGGALETVLDTGDVITGVLFHQQTPDDLLSAVRTLNSRHFDPQTLRAHAERFDRSIFKEKILAFVQDAWSRRNTS